MKNTVQLPARVFECGVFREAVPFRLYCWLASQANQETETIVLGITVKKGQYLRSYSKLSEDLNYIESRGEKYYSKSTISRAVEKLVQYRLVQIEETVIGTLFTLLDFIENLNGESAPDAELFQDDGGTAEVQSKNTYETAVKEAEQKYPLETPGNRLERSPDKGIPQTQRTWVEPYENSAETKSISDFEEKKIKIVNNQEERLTSIQNLYLKLRNKGTFLTDKDLKALRNISQLKLPIETILSWMEQIYRDHQKSDSHTPIYTAAYYEKSIANKLKASTTSKSAADKIRDLFEKLDLEGDLFEGGGVVLG